MQFNKIAAGILAAVSLLSITPITSYAAPKTMADGIIFDAEYYAASNPDVVAELGTDESAMYNHYKMFGQAEGRLPYAAAANSDQPFAIYNGIEFHKNDNNQTVMCDPFGRLAGDATSKVLSATVALPTGGDNTLYYRAQNDCFRDTFGILGASYIYGEMGFPCRVYLYYGNLMASVSADNLLYLYQKEAAFESVYDPELQARIKDGSSQKSAVTAVANYVADKITYDYSIKGVKEKNKIHCGTALEEGSGICHDYAEAFAALIALVPINEQGVVDWTTGTRNVIKANIVCSSTHAWNIVTYDGAAHQLDVCYYDAVRNPKWLDMGASEQAETHHHIGQGTNGIIYLR